MPVCSVCGQDNPAGFRFCGACAAPLTDQATQPREERKLVTALFCDLVGSTAQAERMDVEDVQAILTRYHERVAERIERWGGTVEKFIGDAVVALFGVPAAREDDPERAVRAALAIREWVASQDEVHVRIAINTGEALVRVGARAEQGEHLATGDVLNTAARLQSEAPADGILVGAQTHRVTSRAIEYRAHAPVAAKGKAEPVAAWEVVDARARYGSDVDDRPARPLVGRERELGILQEALARAQTEQTAQLVTLVGIPGIGKSRLVAELFRIADASREVYLWRQGRSLPYRESQSFWALAEIVKAQAGILESDGAAEARAKLTEMLESAISDPEDRGWIEGHLLALVGLSAGAGSGANEREQAFGAWRRLLEGLAEQRTLILVFEDLHWADDGVLDFVDHLADWASASPILLIGTARPELLERRPAWGGGKRNATTLSIAPLSEEETHAVLAGLLDQALMPSELHTAVVELAAGNPLYAEEYVRMLQDLGLLKRVGRTWQLDTEQELPLPDTIQGLVAARIDALGATEKDLVRDAAVVGKVFWPSAAAAIGLREERELAALLHALERKEFIRRERRSAVARETQYAFLHAIVREVAYRQIPRAGRAEKHRAVAAWIEQLAPDRSADRVEMLAHHYHQALELTRAAGGELDALIPAARSALAQASERAETLHAWAAARELAASALDLTEPGDPARPVLAVRVTRAEMNLSDFDPDRAAAARELSLEQGDFEHAAEAESLRGLMLWQRGAREAALAAYERSVELVAGLPDSPSKLHVLAARARLAAIMHDLETAQRLVEEALGPAERLGRDDYLSSLLNTRGLARANAGQPGGVEDLRRAVEVAERSQEAWSLLQAHNNLAELLWQTGRIEEGAEQLAAYDRTAERFGMQFQLGWLDAQKVYLAYLRGDYGELIDGAERYLSAYADTSTYMEAPQRAILGHAYAVLGRTDAALAFSERGLELSRESQGPEGRGFALLARAHALWSAGRGSEASVTVEELLTDSPALTHLHWLVPLPLLLHEHGLGAECVRILDTAPMPSLWRDALALLADGRFLEAAEVYERIGSRLVWAWTLLLATEHGQVDPRNLGEARQCFRTLDAAPFLRRIDQLNVASA